MTKPAPAQVGKNGLTALQELILDAVDDETYDAIRDWTSDEITLALHEAAERVSLEPKEEGVDGNCKMDDNGILTIKFNPKIEIPSYMHFNETKKDAINGTAGEVTEGTEATKEATTAEAEIGSTSTKGGRLL